MPYRRRPHAEGFLSPGVVWMNVPAYPFLNFPR
jgi:hypothetical protein